MPEAAVFRARISIEDFANTLRGQFIFFLPGLFVKNQKQISRQHIVERIDRTIDRAFVVDVQIDPGLQVLEISLIVSAQINEVFAIKIERLCIAPTFQRFRRRKAFDR